MRWWYYKESEKEAFLEVELKEMGRRCFSAPAKGSLGQGWELIPSLILSFQGCPLLNHHLSKSSYVCIKAIYFFSFSTFLLEAYSKHSPFLHFYKYIGEPLPALAAKMLLVPQEAAGLQPCSAHAARLQPSEPVFLLSYHRGKSSSFFPPLFFFPFPPVYVLSSLIYSLEKETLV